MPRKQLYANFKHHTWMCLHVFTYIWLLQYGKCRWTMVNLNIPIAQYFYTPHGSYMWDVFQKKSFELPGNSRDVQETLPSNPNSPHNFSHIRTRGPIRSPSPCLRRQSKRGKYPYSPRGHAMKSCNTLDLLAILTMNFFWIDVQIHIILYHICK